MSKKLEEIRQMMGDGLSFRTEFVHDEDTGYITHEIFVVEDGDLYMESDPVKLPYRLKIVHDGVSIH